MNVITSNQNTGTWANYTSKSGNSVKNTEENGFMATMNVMSSSSFSSAESEPSQITSSDPELDALKEQMNLLLDNNYSRARFQEVSDNEEEDARWEALLEYVDKNIESMKEIVQARKEELMEDHANAQQLQELASIKQTFSETNTNQAESNLFDPSIFSSSYGSDGDDAIRAEMNGILDGSWNRKKMAELSKESGDKEDESLRDLMEALENATKNHGTMSEEELEELKKGSSPRPAVAVTAKREENSSVNLMGDMT